MRQLRDAHERSRAKFQSERSVFIGFGPEGSRRRRIPSRSAASFDEGQFKHPRGRLEQSNGKGQGPTSIRRCAGTSSTAASAFPRHSALRRTAALSFSQHPAAPQQIDNRIRQPPAPSRQLFNSRQLRDTPAFRPFRSCAAFGAFPPDPPKWLFTPRGRATAPQSFSSRSTDGGGLGDNATSSATPPRHL